jgi:hypothetical protein
MAHVRDGSLSTFGAISNDVRFTSASRLRRGPTYIRFVPEIGGVVGVILPSSMTVQSFLTSDNKTSSGGRLALLAALLAQPLGVRLNSAKCGLQGRRHDRRGGMRCFFPRKGPGRDPHCFSLCGNCARRSRCYLLRYHPVQFGTVSRCHSRRY